MKPLENLLKLRKQYKRKITKKRKLDIFIKKYWFIPVGLIDILLYLFALTKKGPFDFTDYVVTVAIVNTVLFYFILYNVDEDDNDKI